MTDFEPLTTTSILIPFPSFNDPHFSSSPNSHWIPSPSFAKSQRETPLSPHSSYLPSLLTLFDDIIKDELNESTHSLSTVHNESVHQTSLNSMIHPPQGASPSVSPTCLVATNIQHHQNAEATSSPPPILQTPDIQLRNAKYVLPESPLTSARSEKAENMNRDILPQQDSEESTVSGELKTDLSSENQAQNMDGQRVEFIPKRARNRSVFEITFPEKKQGQSTHPLRQLEYSPSSQPLEPRPPLFDELILYEPYHSPFDSIPVCVDTSFPYQYSPIL